MDHNDDMEDILEEHVFHAPTNQAPPSPPLMDSYSPNLTQYVSYGGMSSSWGSKRKVPMVDVMDAHFAKLPTKLDVFVDAIGIRNALIE